VGELLLGARDLEKGLEFAKARGAGRDVIQRARLTLPCVSSGKKAPDIFTGWTSLFPGAEAVQEVRSKGGLKFGVIGFHSRYPFP
jgi:hypothetical protein